MRILAQRKRDSIVSDELILSISNVTGVPTTAQVVTTRSNNSNSNIQLSPRSSAKYDKKGVKVSSVRGPSLHPTFTKSASTRNYKNVRKTPKWGVTSDRIGNRVVNFLRDKNCCSCGSKGEEELVRYEETYLDQYSRNDVIERGQVSLQSEIDLGGTRVAKEDTARFGCSAHSSSVTGVSSVTRENLERLHVEDKFENRDTNTQAGALNTANLKIMRTGIYHEKQVKSLCALHALNNLLQDGKAFKQENLDKICSELDPNSWVNPHKSVFGLGNYDINVIMTALQQKNLEAVWFDKRKDPFDELNFENVYGFILNIPSDCRLGWLALPIKRKHWVAIRNLPSISERDSGRSNYYNLDSKFDKPDSIGTTENLVEYLRGELKSPEKELFIVVTEDVGRIETWRKHPPPLPSTSVTSAVASGTLTTHLLPVPTTSGDNDAAAGGGNRRTSNDSGVVDLLPDLRDINVVDLNKEDLMRRQSSGVWSDLT